MIAVIHVDVSGRTVTLDPFARDPDRQLSVSCGDLQVFEWEEFKREGFAAVKQAMRDYHTVYRPGLSQFDRMRREDKIAFMRKHVSFQVVQRTAQLWWIDLMEPVGDGSIPGPVGPPYRVEFCPSDGAARFFGAIMGLMPSSTKYGDE
jgi:hypothetical protein